MLLSITFVTLSHYSYFLEVTTEMALKKEGENCGHCYCPPTYTAGNCAPGLICEHNSKIPDAAGVCIRQGKTVFID